MISDILFSFPLIRVVYRIILSLFVFKPPLIYIVNWLSRHKMRRVKLYNGLQFNIIVPFDQVAILEVIGKKRYGMIKRANVIIDIGAHIGSFSCFMAYKFRDVQVYSYEPEKKNFNALQTNIKLNKLRNIMAFNLAVGEKMGKRKFYIQNDNLGAHSLYVKSQEFVEVDCKSLKDIFDSNNIQKCDFLKMDCEGAEYEILYSTSQEYFDRIEYITLEYHDWFLKDKHHKELIKLLQEKGFKVEDVKVDYFKEQGIIRASKK